MKLEVVYDKQFKRDFKKAKNQRNLELLELVIELLCAKGSLAGKMRDHALTGNWKGYRELHLAPDWLLIYKVLTKENKLRLARLGSHSELFK